MGVTIKKSGAFFASTRNQAFEKAKRDGLNNLGGKLVNALQSRAPVDQGKFKKSIQHSVTGTGAGLTLSVFADSKNAPFAEAGRGPGRQPPPDVMLKLVQRKGLGGSSRSAKTGKALTSGLRRSRNSSGRLRTRTQSLLAIQKGIAFLIGRSIGRKGTKGSFIFRDSNKRHATLIRTAIKLMEAKVYKSLGA